MNIKEINEHVEEINVTLVSNSSEDIKSLAERIVKMLFFLNDKFDCEEDIDFINVNEYHTGGDNSWRDTFVQIECSWNSISVTIYGLLGEFDDRELNGIKLQKAINEYMDSSQLINSDNQTPNISRVPIRVFDILQSDKCLDKIQAKILFDIIKFVLDEEVKMEIDFEHIRNMVAKFANNCFGLLLKYYNREYIDSMISFKNCSDGKLELIKASMDNSEKFYKEGNESYECLSILDVGE